MPNVSGHVSDVVWRETRVADDRREIAGDYDETADSMHLRGTPSGAIFMGCDPPIK